MSSFSVALRSAAVGGVGGGARTRSKRRGAREGAAASMPRRGSDAVTVRCKRGSGGDLERAEDASCSKSFPGSNRGRESTLVGGLAAAVVAGCVVGGVGANGAAMASLPAGVDNVQRGLANEVKTVKKEVRKDVRLIEREIAIDTELIERDVEKKEITLELFLEKEPPVLVGFLALMLVNGGVGLVWALFFRETAAGPGGEFGKGIVALRKEVVKGILKFFGSIMGSYVKESSRSR